MKSIRYCLGGLLIFLCLLGSCSMWEFGPEDFLAKEETSPKEKEKASDEETISEEETLNEEENPDETQRETQEPQDDHPEEIPPTPAFILCEILPENEIVFEFSGPVSLESLSFDPDLEFEKIEEEGSEIIIKLTGDPAPGLLVEVDLQVKDEHENLINEQVSFNIRNNRVPQMQINELRTEYSSTGSKAEFIEFKMLSDGNLGALRVFAEWNNKAPQIYEFEPVDVKKGEYVVLHLRTLEESCKDEYGEDMDISGGSDSSPTARDFWISGSKKLLHKTDAIYVLDQDDRVLDAVMLSESPSESWDKTYFTEAAKFLFEHDAWKSPAGTICSPVDAVDTSGIKTSTAKSISRKEDVENTHTAADWYVTTQGVTPGLPNKL